MSSQSRLVRVFISSTFRDFLGERDELVKKVFPELRRRCKSRYIELVEVDLRWGITEEQSKQGDTLRICLEEIDKCRPSAPVFFVGLLGERYGWIPEADFYPGSVLEDENLGWVREHVGSKSVTELEILHGVLNNPKMGDKAFFYFRNTGYERRHWEEISAGYPDLSPEDFTNKKEQDPDAASRKQEQLKEEIAKSGLSHAPRGYERPVDLAALVLEDLWRQIDSVFPADEVPDELEAQRMNHEVFAASRLGGYVERPGFLEAIDEVLAPAGSPVKVVTGESGGGKSALLARWMVHAAPNLPECHFVHYIGGAPESSCTRSLVRRLMQTIRAWGVVADPIPDDHGEAVQVLPDWLAHTAKVKPGGVIIVLDALNQLDSEKDQELRWLPGKVEGVKWVLSTLPGRSHDALVKRGWLTPETTVAVPPLEQDERRDIILHYLAIYTKRLAPELVERIVTAPQTGNPLYLKVLLDELRLRARHEELVGMTESLLEAKDPVELFISVLKNLEELDSGRKNLVREAMGYLQTSRRGLSEGELLELLSDHAEPSTHPLPRSLWSPLYLALDGSLVERNGRLDFFHDYLREAVEREYLDEDWERQRIHERLGEVALAWSGERFSPSLRRYGLAHGAWHLKMIGQHEELWNILKDEGFRAAQREEFGSSYEVVNGLKNGISVYSRRKGETESDDARLSHLVLGCGGVVLDMHNKLRSIFEDCLTDGSAAEDHIKSIMPQLKSLDSTAFLHACLLLVYRASVAGQGKDVSISKRFFKAIEDEIDARIDGEIEVVKEIFHEPLAKLIPHEFWTFVKSKCQFRKSICEFFEVNVEDDFEHFDGSLNDDSDSEEDALLACDAMDLAGQNNWSGAIDICSQVANNRHRSDVLFAISRVQSEHKLFEESLHTFVLACTQESQPSQRDWNSLGNLCYATALKLSRTKAIEVAKTIEDAVIRSKTIARIASLTWPNDRQEALSRYRSALAEATTLGESGFFVDAITSILNEIRHSDIINELQDEIEKSFSGLDDDQWRSLGYESLALNQFRLGLCSKSLRIIRNIPRHEVKSRAYAAVAQTCYENGKIKFAVVLFNASLSLVSSCEREYNKSEALAYFSDRLSRVGSFDGKGALLEKALEAANNLHEARDSATVIRNIAQALEQSEFTNLRERLSDTGTFWRQFHIQVACAPALKKAGQSEAARKTIVNAFKQLGQIEFGTSKQNAAEAFDFIIDTCCHMEIDVDHLKNSLGDLLDFAIPGCDSNYVGLVQLMSKQASYQDALACVSEILQGSNRVKALLGLANAMILETDPSLALVDFIGSAVRSQNDYDFLIGMKSLHDCTDSTMDWIRYFANLCPENINIGLKLITDLITSNMMDDNMDAVRQINELCPELELSGYLC